MKIALFLALVITLPAVAAVRVNVECGPSYGPSADNLALRFSQNNKDFTVGYTNIGNFSPIKLNGCRERKVQDHRLFCDGVAIGAIGEIALNEDFDLVAPLSLNPDVDVEIVGSCRSEDQRPLTIHVLNKGAGQCVGWFRPTEQTR